MYDFDRWMTKYFPTTIFNSNTPIYKKGKNVEKPWENFELEESFTFQISNNIFFIPFL